LLLWWCKVGVGPMNSGMLMNPPEKPSIDEETFWNLWGRGSVSTWCWDSMWRLLLRVTRLEEDGPIAKQWETREGRNKKEEKKKITQCEETQDRHKTLTLQSQGRYPNRGRNKRSKNETGKRSF
jgi:hypothetical protein